MSVLCDWQIKQRCEKHQMIWPFRMDLLNPASLDVVIGTQLMIEVADTKELQRIDISDKTAEHPYMLLPSEFILAETLETMNIPPDLAVQFVLKSSRAREGYQHMLAGWADPGFVGISLPFVLRSHDLIRKCWPFGVLNMLLLVQMRTV